MLTAFVFFFSRVSAQKSCQNNISTSLQVFCLLICFFTCLSDFVLIPLWGRNARDRLHQGLFRPHLWLLLHRSPSFPTFPVCLLFLLGSQKHPGLSLHLLICSETVLKHMFSSLFHGSFHPSLLSSASLVLLLACKIVLKSGVHQETSSNRSVPPTVSCPLSTFPFHQYCWVLFLTSQQPCV